MNLGIQTLLPFPLFGKEFYQTLKNQLQGIELLVFDLETGGLPGFAKANPYGVTSGKEALCPYTGRILVGGLLDNSLKYMALQDDAERQIVQEVFSAMTRVYEAGGIILGHNLLGFDFSFLVGRAGLLGVPIPEWLSLVLRRENKYKAQKLRVVDTCLLIDARSVFGYTMSLSTLPGFWGRPFQAMGSDFGERWATNDPAVRKELLAYNCWNLVDTLCLAVYSGVLEQFRKIPSAPDPGQPLPVGDSWKATDYEGKLSSVWGSVPHLPPTDLVYFDWLTAPLPDLKAKGPGGNGWGRRKAETINEYPFSTSGRVDPLSMQVVGFVVANAKGVQVVLHPQDEAKAICEGLSVVAKMRMAGRVFTSERKGFLNILLFRASRYGMVLEPWLLGEQKTWLHDLSDACPSYEDKNGRLTEPVSAFAVRSGLLQGFADISLPPTYCGQDQALFNQEAQLRALAALNFISHSPLVAKVAPCSLLAMAA